MINEFFFLQLLSLIILIFFINSINILTLWYLAGVYLIIFGLITLFDDGDIFVGFLWVIDLGVGLIFFIFILHFSNFLNQKSLILLSKRFFLFFSFFFFFFLFFSFFFSNAENANYNYQLKKIWFFFVSWYNYYLFYNSHQTTELNLLREIYFYNNSFEFFLINLALFYGIFIAINLSFLIKKIFNYLNLPQIKNLNLLSENNSNFFIKNQNFVKQQNTSAGARSWIKKKLNNWNDF
uniref:Nad6 n=1 Tax=Paraurostyla sp. TaxID=6014 RepID=A0A3Q8B947_9STIC|nr:Nad6 [Paraurostyla sp.]